MDREATVPTDDRALNRRGLSRDKISSVCVLVLRYLFFTRYSWLLGMALIALTPLSLRAFPGMLANLYVLDVPAQVYHVSWIALWCAVAVMETMRVTTLNAQFRFEDYQRSVERFRETWGQSAPSRRPSGTSVLTAGSVSAWGWVRRWPSGTSLSRRVFPVRRPILR